MRDNAFCFITPAAHPRSHGLPTRRIAVRVARVVTAIFAVCIVPVAAHAALSVVGTRFVYSGDARALTIAASNAGDVPILVQIWLDDGNAGVDPSRLRVPFVVTPPIARLDPRQRLPIRVQSVGNELASDRESRFWINLLEVPPATLANDNTLRVAYRLRMKLLFRPPGLAGHPDEAPERLQWTHAGAQGRASLIAFNPTPYYVTLTRLLLRGEPVALAGGAVDVAPFGRADIPSDGRAGTPPGEIVFDAVGDDGRSREHRARLEPP
ncbi:molecular chaperone [Burkholderia ubonensis]|uniref:fimbrial biogenesis chaperone n=1 Tax=Burkholderia ubonensis TaxID=101571 RepID=UPI00075A20B8|nr:fimbria/pilus periplasmic chaperone [Burkholderia ubonensis]KVR18971.1 phytochrome sensor protein [Burkholderia ubonensis]KVT68981.1 phytochrome sensor protein [Burkholderia ubonensis]KVZ57438.1 phytochrome sensor protein [Burkholderia ubonensis]